MSITLHESCHQHHVPESIEPLVSVIIPCYNEEEVIEPLYSRLQTVMNEIKLPYELIFVNDGSHDGTLDKLSTLASINPNVKVLDFSRNFGHQIAVTAGMEHAKGDIVILIDADLQDPPELIKTFIEKWREGYDVVYAVRQHRQGETIFKKLTANWFYRVLRRLTDVSIPVDTGDFRLMNRRVVDSLLTIKEKHRFVRGLVSWVGFKQVGVPYHRDERYAGQSKYPLKKMVKLAMDGITSFSSRPLQWASRLGFLTAGFGFLGVLLILYLKLFSSVTIQGWTSLMTGMLFLGGVQLIVLGILGEYIGRIYDEVRNRPLYILNRTYNIDK